MQGKATVRYHFTAARLARIKDSCKQWQRCGGTGPHTDGEVAINV